MSNLVMNFEGIRVGTIIHNDNGDDYAVVAINPKQDRTLLVKCGSEDPYYVGAWALQKCRDGSGNWYWGQGHYFMDSLNKAVEYVLDTPKVDEEKIYRNKKAEYLKQDIMDRYDVPEYDLDKIVEEIEYCLVNNDSYWESYWETIRYVCEDAGFKEKEEY